MNVNLTPELERLVHRRLKTGLYNSASEVVREALRLMDAHDRARDAQLSRFQARLDSGLASLGRGEGVDGERFMSKLLAGLPSTSTGAKHRKR